MSPVAFAVRIKALLVMMVLVLSLAGCPAFGPGDLPGTYLTRWDSPGGSENLEIRDDGIFLQNFTPAGSTTALVSEGKWEFSSGRVRFYQYRVNYRDRSTTSASFPIMGPMQALWETGRRGVVIIIDPDRGHYYIKLQSRETARQ